MKKTTIITSFILCIMALFSCEKTEDKTPDTTNPPTKAISAETTEPATEITTEALTETKTEAITEKSTETASSSPIETATSVTPTSPPTTDITSLDWRTILDDTNAVCGIYYFGRFDNITTDDELINLIDNITSTEYFQIFDTMPEFNYVKFKDAKELYFVLPQDFKSSVAVNEWICDESNGFVGETGEVIYRSDYGTPFFVLCNKSDYVPDSEIIIVKENGDTINWNPRVNLTDGMVNTVADGLIVDFTKYE